MQFVFNYTSSEVNKVVRTIDLFFNSKSCSLAAYATLPLQGDLICFGGLLSNLSKSYCGASTATFVIDTTESKTTKYQTECFA